MNLEEFSEKFQPLPAQEKVKFLYIHLDELSENDKIRLLTGVIRDERTSPLVKATALKFLRRTSYQDPGFYQQHLNNQFQALAKAAKRAAKDAGEQEKKNRHIADAVVRKVRSTKDKAKRMKIIKAVAGLQASWVPLVLMDGLADPSETVRDFLIKELAGRETLSISLLCRRLAAPPWYAKSAVLRVLGMRKAAEAVRVMETVLDDANTDVRRTAAQVLGEIGGKEAVGMLVRLAKDNNVYVRSAAEEALRKVSEVRFS